MKIPGWLRWFGVVGTFLISAFDIGADWHAASIFLTFEPAWGATIAYCVICAVASLFFFTECFLARLKCDEEEDNTRTRVRDYFSIALLLVEDFGSALVFYAAFYKSNCSLFIEVFVISRAHYYALVATIVSCTWKAAVCCKYCFRRCDDATDWWIRKVVRVLLALAILGLAAGALSLGERGMCSRPECVTPAMRQWGARLYDQVNHCTGPGFPTTSPDIVDRVKFMTPASDDLEASTAIDDEDLSAFFTTPSN